MFSLKRCSIHAGVILVVFAFHVSLTQARLYKRSGHYQLSPGSPHHSTVTLFEPKHSPTIAGTASADHESEHKSYAGGYYAYNHHTSEHESPAHSAHSGPGGDKSGSGYSIGSGLRSIAQGSANQAYTAVANQHAAAKQAAFIAKNTLAQAASQAAATAQAALAGKQVLLQELEQQAAEAQRALSRELDQLNVAKIAAKLAHQTAQAAYSHVSVLTAAVNNAKSVADQAEQTSSEVANQLASQSQMVGQAKNRLEQVEEQLKQARIDFVATKEATLKAASSAAEAHVNASKAAAHASLGLHENASQHQTDDEGESYDEHIEPSSVGHSGEGDDGAYQAHN